MIYFDNSATTKPCEAAVSAVSRGLCDCFGNPSSGHPEGIKAAGELRAARQTLSMALHAEPKNIYFTSGGTASDNIAIFGGAKSGVGSHVVTSAIEHDAVLGCFKALEERGFSVTYVKPRSDGNLHIEDIISSMCKLPSSRGFTYVTENPRASKALKQPSTASCSMAEVTT